MCDIKIHINENYKHNYEHFTVTIVSVMHNNSNKLDLTMCSVICRDVYKNTATFIIPAFNELFTKDVNIFEQLSDILNVNNTF